MIRKFCDVCGREVEGRLVAFSIPCHLWQFRGQLGYVDKDGNPTSGKMNSIEMCQGCSNSVFSASVKKIEALMLKATTKKSVDSQESK